MSIKKEYLEILFSDNYCSGKNNDWAVISVKPKDYVFIDFETPETFKGDNGRLGYRYVYTDGSRGEINIDFKKTINFPNLPLLPPSFLSPLSGSSYKKNIQIIFDEKSLNGTASATGYYYLFYSSQKLGIDERQITKEIRVGSGSFYWDVAGLDPSEDYKVLCFILDGYGNRSKNTTIDNIGIGIKDKFIIDTTPPDGYIKIINNSRYVRDSDVTLRLYAHDETTSVPLISIIENSADSSSSSSLSYTEQYSTIKTWTLSSADGIKKLEASFKDFAGNTIDENSVFKWDRDFFDVGSEIADEIHTEDGSIYVAVDGENPGVYKNNDLLISTDDIPTAIVFFDNVLYIATTADSNKGKLLSAVNGSAQEVMSFLQNNSVISSMSEFKGVLYIGMKNGFLYSFNGSSFTLTGILEGPIEDLNIVNGLLFIALKNSNKIYSFNGLTRTEIDIGD